MSKIDAEWRAYHLMGDGLEPARRPPLARVTVYMAVRYDPNTDQKITLSFMGAREALKLVSLTPVEGTGIEIDESELDANWLYHPKPGQ